MNRLTKIDRYGHFYTNKANCRNICSSDGERLEGVFFKNQVLAIDGKAIDKLGKLEDIEEQLGIDLITLLRALEYGIYVYNDNDYGDYSTQYIPKIIKISATDICSALDIGNKCFNLDVCQEYYFSDYGKTWALTKEELENE